MSKSLKILIMVIGALSLIAGIYLAVSGSDFSSYFSGILIGVILMGSAMLVDKSIEEEKK